MNIRAVDKRSTSPPPTLSVAAPVLQWGWFYFGASNNISRNFKLSGFISSRGGCQISDLAVIFQVQMRPKCMKDETAKWYRRWSFMIVTKWKCCWLALSLSEHQHATLPPHFRLCKSVHDITSLPTRREPAESWVLLGLFTVILTIWSFC